MIDEWSFFSLAKSFRFRFELDAIENIEPWGEPGRASLSWFGLTSGRYWIDTPLGEVMAYTPEIRKLWNFPFPYVDYQIARLFEDLQEHLPAMLEPVPEDIAIFASDRSWLERLALWIDSECGESEGLRRWDLNEAAMAWWWQRELDTAYLSHGPRISIWRTNDDVHFRWTTRTNEDRGVPVFAVPAGDVTISLSTFQTAAFGFCEEVLSMMSSRVNDIQSKGWDRADCILNVTALVAEQQAREELFKQVKVQGAETNWPEVRTHLGLLKFALAGDS